MPLVFAFTYWSSLILIGGFFGIVFWNLLTGGIILDQCRSSTNAADWVALEDLSSDPNADQ
jgi:hypothetical protein